MKKTFQPAAQDCTASPDFNKTPMRQVAGLIRHARGREQKSFEELSEIFRRYNAVAGWDELPDNHPIKTIIENAKPTP